MFSSGECSTASSRSRSARPSGEVHGFADAAEDVRAAVQQLRDAPYLVATEIRGALYDVETGRVTEVR